MAIPSNQAASAIFTARLKTLRRHGSRTPRICRGPAFDQLQSLFLGKNVPKSKGLYIRGVIARRALSLRAFSSSSSVSSVVRVTIETAETAFLLSPSSNSCSIWYLLAAKRADISLPQHLQVLVFPIVHILGHHSQNHHFPRIECHTCPIDGKCRLTSMSVTILSVTVAMISTAEIVAG